ncbi:MAG: hypothetical protein EP343_27470 [Deltaproteobacteria bacterium]|nr:MAG: hypothetical protein EP343_27470 [Deltaproteobacteria bacterium]
MKVTVQLLEGSSSWSHVTPKDVRATLLKAGDILPLHRLLVGWNLPLELLDVCKEASISLGAQLDLWQPLMTTDGSWNAAPAWRVVGPQGLPATAALGLEEFCFLCPHHPGSRDAILSALEHAIQRFSFDGVFLDRIRFPSPAPHPFSDIGCFCSHCQQSAASHRLDLGEVRASLFEAEASPHAMDWMLECLRTESLSLASLHHSQGRLWAAFLDWREASITHMVGEACALAKERGLVVGLDGFSPLLSRSVGQKLSALTPLADWTKVMTYGHVLAPAGIPGELSDWLGALATPGLSPDEALARCREEMGLDLPTSLQVLRTAGVSPEFLAAEVKRAKAISTGPVFAGIELVELDGITHLSPSQIQDDLEAFVDAGADGLSLSWDLMYIPEENLRLVAEVLG